MEIIKSLIHSGQLFDLMLAMVLLEFVVLAGLWWKNRRGVQPLSLLFNLAAGGCLMLALRSLALNQLFLMLTFLVLSLVFHVLDLQRRWQAGNSVKSSISKRRPQFSLTSKTCSIK